MLWMHIWECSKASYTHYYHQHTFGLRNYFHASAAITPGKKSARQRMNKIMRGPVTRNGRFALSGIEPWSFCHKIRSLLTKLTDISRNSLHFSLKWIFFLSLSLLIGWQLSIWNCCKPFFSLLTYNCQLLYICRLSLSIVVDVFPRVFFRILLLKEYLLQTRYV
jgi:hypothetical protein